VLALVSKRICQSATSKQPGGRARLLGKQTDAEQQYRLIAKRFDNDFQSMCTGNRRPFTISCGDVPAGRVHYNRAMGCTDSMRTRVLAYWIERSFTSPRWQQRPIVLR